MVWTPVFYIFLNKTIRRAIFGELFDPVTEASSLSRGENIITVEKINFSLLIIFVFK
jgi:hypothetical protein